MVRPVPSLTLRLAFVVTLLLVTVILAGLALAAWLEWGGCWACGW